TCADDSVRFPHVKVGHCQGFIPKRPLCRFFFVFNPILKNRQLPKGSEESLRFCIMLRLKEILQAA
ncbi:hypothetical protein, partial [Legionella jamestowniensis]|uniref:hypothetical protein n=1 Tax=Legionella jamestowniensis TaxID=455 RepID=UPI001C40026A